MIYKKIQSGFSLVETLVSITILLLVIVGPMSISSSASKSTSFSSEQVVAFFLAQEGAELLQSGRDDVILPKFDATPVLNTWADFTDTTVTGPFNECFTSFGCGLELNTDVDGSLKSVTDCGSSSCLLYLNSGNGRDEYTYSPTGNVATAYTRIIYLTSINASEVKVTSKVSWRTGSQRKAQEVVVETFLFNVYGN